MHKWLLLIVLIVATVAGAYWLTRPVPSSETQKKAPEISGVYADDWMAQCGALGGDAQEKCTRLLDAAYGRTAGAPIGK